MSKINFYRQARGGSGIRSGIDLDRAAAFSLFGAGAGEADPSLLWYVDIEWAGPPLPPQAEEARAFLLRQEPLVRTACHELADRLVVGIDEEPAPFAQPFDPQTPGVQAAIFCSAVRRISGREMARNRLCLNAPVSG